MTVEAGGSSGSADRYENESSRKLAGRLVPGDRALVPVHVPEPAELATLFAEVRHAVEAEPLVERDRRWVGLGDPGECAMHVLAFEGVEERPIERVADPAANEPGVDVHAGLDGRVVRGPWSIPSAARETDDPTGADRDDDAMPTAGMFREPLAALFKPRRARCRTSRARSGRSGRRSRRSRRGRHRRRAELTRRASRGHLRLDVVARGYAVVTSREVDRVCARCAEALLRPGAGSALTSRRGDPAGLEADFVTRWAPRASDE